MAIDDSTKAAAYWLSIIFRRLLFR
jgi:hypothetical protein